MQLKVTTDYAIRAVLFLATKGEIVTSKEISINMGIPQNYVLKIMRQLSRAEFIKTHIGVHGGFSLNKNSKEITLLSIIQTMESTIKVNRCLEKDGYCSRYATEHCPVHYFYCDLQNELEMKLSSISIQNLLSDSEKRIVERMK